MGLLTGRALVVTWETVVGDLLPARRVGDELPVLRADARVTVEGAEADPDYLGSRLQSCEPHSEQNSLAKPLSGRQARTSSSPERMRREPGETRACGEAAVPDLRWQRVQ